MVGITAENLAKTATAIVNHYSHLMINERETLELCAARIRAVLELHWDKRDSGICGHCLEVWPCPTISALNGEN